MRVVLQLLFFLSPIVWTIDMVPESLRPWVWLNPLLVQIESVRAVLTRGVAPDGIPLAALFAFSAVVMWSGYSWFRRTRVGFADVV